ncbi:MAG: acyl carrier protein [Muribaculaceae bacterium]|nr:acyl carrier protein [Muribaculaceae bacterium]
MDQKIIDDVKRIAFDVLKDNRIISEDNFDLSQAENMDSVHRVSILVAIEEEYDFIFKLKEISAWNTVNELAAIIEKKM